MPSARLIFIPLCRALVNIKFDFNYDISQMLAYALEYSLILGFNF